MDGHAGDQQQVPVNVHQPGFRTLFRFYHHPSGNGQRTIQPGAQNGAAVPLGADPAVGAGKLGTEFQLEAGTVRVSGGDQEALGISLRQTESDQRAAAPAGVVFPSRCKDPAVSLGKPGVSGFVQRRGRIGGSMVSAVGAVQKAAEGFGIFVHNKSFPGRSEKAENLARFV